MCKSVGIGPLSTHGDGGAGVAISSGVVCTLPCPMAEEPTAVESPIVAAGGIVLWAAPEPRRLVKPKLSAMLTSREPRQLDAQRREHRIAGNREGVQEGPAARLAAGVLERVAVDRGAVMIGKVSAELHDPAWSAAVEVMIFIVEPGG